MGDFHQHGIITTLHQLHTRSIEDLEAELMELSREHPMALVLPSLYSELEGPALSGILDELTQVSYLDQIVVGLDRASEDQFRHALDFFWPSASKTKGALERRAQTASHRHFTAIPWASS